MTLETKGTVFDIQNYTVNDGPGIRIEFFLKGCSMRCQWCSNPESQLPRREFNIGFKCIGVKNCGWCHKACPMIKEGKKPFVYDRGFVIGVDRSICDTCEGAFRCAKMCPSNNLRVWGKEITVAEAMELILKERSAFERSGGGVTISGGEALLQHEFVRDLLMECRREGIHTVVETALHVPEENVKAILPHVDMMISDIKSMNTEVHKKYTGVGNELTLSNLKLIADEGIPLILRIPVVPGVNDDEISLQRTADFINRDLNGMILQLQLLRFRKLGTEKYRSLGTPYPMENFEPPERAEFEEKIRKIEKFFTDRGVPAVAGTTTRLPGY